MFTPFEASLSTKFGSLGEYVLKVVPSDKTPSISFPLNFEDLTFNAELTDGMEKGKLLLRMKLYSAVDQSVNFGETTIDYQKGTELSSATMYIYYNQNPPGSGIFKEVVEADLTKGDNRKSKKKSRY